MRLRTFTALILVAATADVFTQAPPPGTTFDVVSIKRNAGGTLGNSGSSERPDGGFTLMNITASTLIGRAYRYDLPLDTIVGLPDWAKLQGDRYDVIVTSPLSRPATPDERAAMMRAMLTDRFKLAAHMEDREQSVYELVLARRDGRLGPGLTKIDADCDAQNAGPPPRQSVESFSAPPPPCTLRSTNAFIRDRFGDKQGRLGDVLEGEATIERLALYLRVFTLRTVVNKTGVTGSYRVKMNFDSMSAMRPPAADAPVSDVPSVFTAVQEQLGLKLEPSKAPRGTLVIEHLERPTEN